MRRVVSSSEVPHLWAHQTQDEARTSTGNLYFVGKTIYSYGSHFPIATFVENAQGERAVLFTTENYSVTTQRHKSLTWRAISHIKPVFNVPLKVRWDMAKYHEIYVTSYSDRIKLLSESVARSRPGYTRDYKLDTLHSTVAEANEYCVFFDLEQRFEVPADFDSLKAELNRIRAEQKREEKERQKRIEAENRERIEQWLAGENVFFPYNVDKAYLRIEGSDVVTSKGARFPVTHAAKGLRFVRKVRESGTAYKRNGHTIHLGHYAIDSIDEKGNVKAGCHYVLYEEIERIAPQLESAPVQEEEFVNA
jgi:hypothetical protein